MRSLLALFVVAALGFAIVVKKDTPATAPPPKRPDHSAQSRKQKSLKHTSDEPIAVTHVAVNERERTALR
jgi:hypothetical protein